MAGLKKRGLLALVTAIIGFIALGTGLLFAQGSTAAITAPDAARTVPVMAAVGDNR